MKWLGWDTETANGRAVLIGTPMGCTEPRNWFDVLEWFRSIPSDIRLVAFNLDYDVRAVLLFLPGSVLRRLAVTCRAEYRGTRLEYVPRKRFRIWPSGWGKRRGIACYDVSQFFSGSLDVASAAVLGEGKLSIPRAWLSRMGMLRAEGGWRWNRVKAYCCRDAALAQRLMERLDASCVAAGVPFDSPLSPATLAAGYWRSALRLRPPTWAQRLFQRTYYGARIEVYRRGAIGRTFAYDINSAYPAVLAGAIDPRTCRLVRSGRVSPDAAYGAYHVEMLIPPNESFPPVPVRTDGGLIYPVGLISGWYDKPTVECCREARYAVKILDAWEYMPGERAALLFPEVAAMYLERKSRPEVDLAFKLILNGLYGKTAQRTPVSYRMADDAPPDASSWTSHGDSFRSYERIGQSTHFAVAAHVTGTCRAQLWRACRPYFRALVLLATDCAIFSRSVPFPVGSGLGDWSGPGVGNDTVVVGSGIYTYRVDGREISHARGLRGVPNVRDILRYRAGPVRSVPLVKVDTLLEGVRRERTAAVNIIRKLRRQFDVNFDRKRVWFHPWQSCADVLESSQRSVPWVWVDDVAMVRRKGLKWPKVTMKRRNWKRKSQV